jgi:hypothetical protein
MENYVTQAGFWFFALLVGLLAVYFTLTHLVAKAARMKNRSYLSFWWLSLFLGPWLMALIVAVLPFNEYDPRSPLSLIDSENEPQRAYRNNYSMHKLIGSFEKGWLLIGSVISIIALVAGSMSIAQASRTLDQIDEELGVTSICEQAPSEDDIAAGFTDMGDCLSYRYWSEAERESSGYCPDGYCLDIYVKALSFCSFAEIYVDLKDESGNVIDTVFYTISDISTGEIRSVTISNFENWSDTTVSSLSCLDS